MRYPAKFDDAVEGGVVVTFRDIPEAITQGDSFQEAVLMAKDALETAFDFYYEGDKPIPYPTPAQHGEVMIELSHETWEKVTTHNHLFEGYTLVRSKNKGV